MSLLTIYCCGTCSNVFDASKFKRKKDLWDEPHPNQPKKSRFEVVWEASQNGNNLAKLRVEKILRTRRAAMTEYGQSDYFQGEIVSTLSRQNTGKEFVDWIQIDGPGSGNLQDKILWSKPGNHYEATGSGLGYGLQVNVRHAMGVIKNTFDDSLYEDEEWEDSFTGETGTTLAAIKSHGMNSGRPTSSRAAITPQLLQQQIAKMGRTGGVTQVNLMGWSRGAVTCIAIANAIQQECNGVRVNIFAVDPVPGAYAETTSWQKTELPACVDEYFGVYARDEVSVGFSPVIPKLKGHTNMTLLPLPGMHASLAGNSHLDKNALVSSPWNLEAPGRIARNWAEDCLLGWGTNMTRSAAYRGPQLLRMYRDIVARNAQYKGMQKYSYTKLRQGNLKVFRKVYISGSGWTSNYWSFDELGKSDKYSQMNMFFEDGQFVNWDHKALHQQFG